jgi:hypothetical protein
LYVLPEIRAMRSYWLVAHSDLRDVARVSAVWDFIARSPGVEQGLHSTEAALSP